MSVENEPADSGAEALVKKYRKGMKDLGRSLIVLGVFQLVLGGLLLALSRDALIFTIVAMMAVAHFVMGLLLLRHHAWVNYLVAVWSALLVAASCIGMGLQSGREAPGASTGSCIGLLIAAGLLYYSVRNISVLSKVRAKGRDG